MSLLRRIFNRIYTLLLKPRFKHFGASVIKYKPDHLMGTQYISIGDRTVLDNEIQLTARKVLETDPVLKVGNGCLIRKGSHITAINRIEIGDNLLTGTNVLISDNSHGKFGPDKECLSIDPKLRPLYSKGPVCIGNNVWLGNNVCVLAGVTIGDGVVVGANSVVTHDIPSYSMAVGVPAKIVKSFS